MWCLHSCVSQHVSVDGNLATLESLVSRCLMHCLVGLQASHYLFKGLPLMQWLPRSQDIDLLREWLLDSPLSSPQSHLACIVVEQMNWSSYNQGTDLFLSRSTHRHMAMLLVQMYRCHLAGKAVTSLSVENLKPVCV